MDNITDPSEHNVHTAQAQLQHPSSTLRCPHRAATMLHTTWRPLTVQWRVRALEAHDAS